MIRRFNIWFDSLKEPNRTWYFFGWIIIMIILLNLPFKVCAVIGGLMFVISMVIGITRM